MYSVNEPVKQSCMCCGNVAWLKTWAGSMRKLQKGKGGQLDFLHLVEELMLKLSQEELELFFVQAAQYSDLWWSDSGPFSASEKSW